MKKKEIIWIGMVLIVALSAYVYGVACTGTNCAFGAGITIADEPPTIDAVTPPSTVTLTAGTTTTVYAFFNASDPNGVDNLNDSSAQAVLYRSGEPSRTSSSCSVTDIGSTAIYNCSIDHQFYDLDGTWSVNVSISDLQGNFVYNDTLTYTINSLDAVDNNDTTINWTGIVPSTSNNLGDTLLFTNKGNQDYVTSTITSQNATGSTDTIEHNSFYADADGVVAGRVQLSDSGVAYNDFSLPRGASSTDPVYWFLDVGAVNPDTYISIADWTFVVS